MRLLFIVAHWHGLAKLRLHTDTTLDILDKLTASLGKELRGFNQYTCSAFTTWELRREANARNRRRIKQGVQAGKNTTMIASTASISGAAREEVVQVARTTISETTIVVNTRKRGRTAPGKTQKWDRMAESDMHVQANESTTSAGATAGLNTAAQNDGGRQQKGFNLNTYKYHALGDVADTIRRYGTTDSYSTEPVIFDFNSSFNICLMLLHKRVNWSTAHQSQGTWEQAKSSTSSNWPRSNDVKHVFTEFATSLTLGNLLALMKLNSHHRQQPNIT